MDKSRVMEILEKTGVMQRGHFLLTSGRHSDTYMQCAHLFKYPEYCEEIAADIAARFKDDGVDYVVGPAIGGIIFAYEVSRCMGVPNLFAEREKGEMTFRRGFEIEPGSKVLIVEDVVTTGGSVIEVMECIKEFNAEIVGVGVVIDRSLGSANFGVRLESIVQMEISSYPPDECPICDSGEELVKPGSRKVK